MRSSVRLITGASRRFVLDIAGAALARGDALIAARDRQKQSIANLESRVTL
jgi:NAD(P)-dependent dehydrogenase (short-subunit alcohol dehydrogenase family)